MAAGLFALFAGSSVVKAQPIGPMRQCSILAGLQTIDPETNQVIANFNTVAGTTRCREYSGNRVLIRFRGRNVYIAKAGATPISTSSTASTPSTTSLSPTGTVVRIVQASPALPNVSAPDREATNDLRLQTSGQATTAVDGARPLRAPGRNTELTLDATLAGQSIQILPSQNSVTVRSNSFQTSSFACPEGVSISACHEASEIDYTIPLTLTGNRARDRDSNINFVEATYKVSGNQFSGWFNENQTSLKPDRDLIRQQTAVRQREQWDQMSEVALSGQAYTLEQSVTSKAARGALLRSLDQNSSEFRVNRSSAGAAEAARAFQTNRGLIRLHNTRNGMCGSYDYSQDGGTESYASPIAACSIAQLTERWRKEQCPSNGACRLQIGDISHRTLLRFDGHKSHTHGHCVDFQTIRKQRSTSRVAHTDSQYDRSKTEEFLKLLRELGGTNIYFNDPQMIRKGLSSYIRNHDSHIHVCFKPGNSTAERQCSSYTPDSQMCPSSEVLFSHPLMTEYFRSI